MAVKRENEQIKSQISQNSQKSQISQNSKKSQKRRKGSSKPGVFSKRNFKYGTSAIVLTAALVAVVLAVNLIVSALSSRYSWYFDMSGDVSYHLSDAATALLDKVDGNDRITVYFLTDPDMLSGEARSTNYLGQSSAWGMRPIHEIALEIAEKYSFVSVEYVNYAKDPRLLRDITGDDYDKITFGSTQVLVDCKSELTDASGAVYDTAHNYRIFSRDAFYTFDYADSSVNYVNSFCGDYRLASAISSVSIGENAPTAYFLSGHDESIGSYDAAASASASDANADASSNASSGISESYGSAQGLWQILRDSGYKIKRIDLRYEDFGDEDDALCVIFSPTTDLLAPENSDRFNEVEKLEKFLEGKGHTLAVFADPSVRKLSNLDAFLSEHCGVTLSGGKIKDGGKNSLSVDGLTLVGTTGSSSPIATLMDGAGKAVFSSAQAIKIEDAGVAKGTVSLYDVPDSVVDKANIGSSLMTLTETENGGRVIVCGTSSFVTGECTESPVYSNREVLLTLIDRISDKSAPLCGLKYRIIENDGLDITGRQTTVATLLLAVALPFAVCVLGTIVYLRRRHS